VSRRRGISEIYRLGGIVVPCWHQQFDLLETIAQIVAVVPSSRTSSDAARCGGAYSDNSIREHPFSSSIVIEMVRLITHNLLACHAKGCASSSKNFPLIFQDAETEIREAEFNPDFLRGFMPKIEWNALVGAAKQVVT
jgi:hypothetical protein